MGLTHAHATPRHVSRVKANEKFPPTEGETDTDKLFLLTPTSKSVPTSSPLLFQKMDRTVYCMRYSQTNTLSGFFPTHRHIKFF